MQVNDNLCAAFVDKKSFLVLSPEQLYKWRIKTSECVVQFPASRPCCYMPFTCLSWKLESCKKVKESSRSKNLKNSKSDKPKAVYRYTVGTSSGDILLLSGSGKELQKFSGAHSDRVNCISWTKGNIFYSCSDDMHIAEWDINDSTHKWKWKTGKSAVTSLFVVPDSNTLMSAGKFIKIWDLKTKQLLKRVGNLKSPVSSMFVLGPGTSSSSTKTLLETLEGVCIFSASRDEKAIKILHVGDSKHKKCFSRFLTLPSPARMFEVHPPHPCSDPVTLLVVTNDEKILMYSHFLNGDGKKPITATKTIRLLSQSSATLKIISARFKKCKKSKTVIIAAYGSADNVGFQNINLEDFSDTDIVLYCNEPERKTKLDEKKSVLDINEKCVAKKKRRKSINSDALTMEERTVALIKKSPKLKTAKTIDLLPENNKPINKHPGKINPIMTSSSSATFAQLCDRLTESIEGNSSEYVDYVRWVKVAMNKHSAQLEKVSLDSPVWARLRELVGLRHRLEGALPRLQGSLDLVMSQIVQKQLGKVGDEALQIYEDESSDDNMDFIPYNISDGIEESDELYHESDNDSDSSSESDDET